PAPTGGEAVAAPPSPAGTPVRELAGWRPAWIRYGPFTLSGLVTVAVIAGFAWRIISEAAINIGQLPEVRAAQAEAATIGIAAVVVVLALVGIALVALLSTFGYAFAFWGFRLTRQAEGTLQVRRGLITTRVTTIEERRLRGVEISEPLLLRAVGGARCLAITTGLRVGRGSERGGSMLLPPAPRTEAIRVAAEVLGRPRPIVAALIPHGARAARRRFTRALAVAAILCAGLLLGCWRLGLSEDLWIASLAVFPIAALLAADRAHSLGHVVADGALIVRLGSLIRRRSIVNCEGIIGWNLRQTFFQRRLGLGTLAATTAAGRQRYEALDVPLGEAVRTAEQAVPGLLRPFLVPADRA
ncbi:MAG: PH domain-containing protein, partial [Candidatus Dormiibacterota bacterium]